MGDCALEQQAVMVQGMLRLSRLLVDIDPLRLQKQDRCERRAFSQEPSAKELAAAGIGVEGVLLSYEAAILSDQAGSD